MNPLILQLASTLDLRPMYRDCSKVYSNKSFIPEKRMKGYDAKKVNYVWINGIKPLFLLPNIILQYPLFIVIPYSFIEWR